MSNRKTLLAVLLIVIHSDSSKCENDTKNLMTNLATEHLLRGSNVTEKVDKHHFKETETSDATDDFQYDSPEAETNDSVDEMEILKTITTELVRTTDSNTEHNTVSRNAVEEEIIDGNGSVNDNYEDVTDESGVDTTVGYNESKDNNGSNAINDTEKMVDRANSTTTTSPTKMATSTTTSTLSSPPTTAPSENHMTGDKVAGASVTQSEEQQEKGQRSSKTEKAETKPFQEKPSPRPTVQSQPRSSTVPCSIRLRDWLQDSWLRSPAGILVPLRPMAINRALGIWKDMMADERLNVTDVVLLGFDQNGIAWRSRHNLQDKGGRSGYRTVAEALSKLLLKYQDVRAETVGDATMRALASAAKLVPYDSGLFVVTDKGPSDSQMLPLALRALVQKRLKVYVVWTDPSPDSEDHIGELKNVSYNTEGDILQYSLQVMDVELEPDVLWDALQTSQGRMAKMNTPSKFETLLVRRGGGGATSLGIPVETGVSALRIYIEGAVEHAVLYPPNDGPLIDLYNQSSVLSYSPGSSTNSITPRDVYLALPGLQENRRNMLKVLPASTRSPHDMLTPSTVGLWHLSIRCDTCDYRLTVWAHARIKLETTLMDNNTLVFKVTGPVVTIRESSLIDEYGTELNKLPFSVEPSAQDNVEDPYIGAADQVLMADVELPDIRGSRVYAKIVGRDFRGDPFVRLSEPLLHKDIRTGRSASTVVFPDGNGDLESAERYSQQVYNRGSRQTYYNDTNVLPNGRAPSQILDQSGQILTSVQIGLSSRIYGTPGETLQLHFEVLNNRPQSVIFRFEAIGELKFLRGIQPSSQTVLAGQTANVIVTVGITASAQPGARDLITFTAYGREQVSISAYVYVVNAGTINSDIYAPTLRHNFQGTCLGNLGSDCGQHTWSATIVARDAVGGLLRLSSSPIGISYDSNFIAGSREEVIGTYRATCCTPRFMVTAVDAYGNSNSYIVDISNYFTPAGIAAIVLGVILFIAIIILLIALVYFCIQRKRESKELSSYTRREVS